MSDPAAPLLFCFGLGYSALALARRLRRRGWQVAGTCRTGEKQAELAREGIAAHLFDRDRPLADPAAALAGTTHLLSSVPPDESGDPVLGRHADALAALGGGLSWAGYLSTTGVYGDRGGGWVDEAAELRPTGERGRRRVAAEAAWLALGQRHRVPVHLFRLAGIYGPGRSALDAVRAGQAKRVDKPGQVFSRIHVEDIATVLEASIARPDPGAAYNVCDDDPAPPQEVVAFACDLLGGAPPPLVPFAQAELSAMARSFYEDNKRVDNTRIKRELGVTLRYPDFRAGLRALLDGGDEGSFARTTPRIFWIDAPLAARLAIVSRPQSGERLGPEIMGWKEAGLDVILSLLEHEEAASLGLQSCDETCRTIGLDFISFPIRDRGVPMSADETEALLEALAARLEAGQAVAIHCHAGIGRSGMIAAAVLVRLGLDAAEAFARVAAARGVPVPETEEQQDWVRGLQRPGRGTGAA
jgi:nucleoside-diphosphate-sugar epimerase